ncbi:MAG: hypothetical protein ACLFUJ_15520 [Phycisphaerae bacterium]
MTHAKPTLLAATLALLALAGCSSVTTSHPLTESTAAELQKTLTGTWVAGDSALRLQFDSKGIGRLAGVNWDDQAEEFLIYQGQIHAIQADDQMFLSLRVKSQDSGWSPDYVLLAGRIIDSGDWVLWQAKPEDFARAVQKGTFDGKVTKDERSTNVELTGKPAAILKTLQAHSSNLFDYRQPIVLRKLPAASEDDENN